jgi:phospholipid/cholesterol/gamma-HCH transport system substrate-binding protein
MALTTAAKVGILTLVALIALGTVIVWKTEIFMVREGYELIGSFKDIEGLTIGSEVRYRGFRVGKVMRIDPGPQDIRVYSVINKDIRFPDDSYLRVSYDGIVGLKFLEIRPGTSEVIYAPPKILQGTQIAGIVDFVDIGSQNLEETKKIMEAVRLIVENPKLQQAILHTIFTADKVATDLEKLTAEIRRTNEGIGEVVNDPNFQENVKGTIRETEKTLSSANRFFESVGKINVRASVGIDVGTIANEVRGNVDIIQSERSYFRLGVGEGPTRQLSLLDVLFTSKERDDFGFRLGVINNQLGGGLAFYPYDNIVLRGDIYDINNPRPKSPKMRLGVEYELIDYMDLTLKADDILNEGDRNFSLGIRVKGAGEKIY